MMETSIACLFAYVAQHARRYASLTNHLTITPMMKEPMSSQDRVQQEMPQERTKGTRHMDIRELERHLMHLRPDNPIDIEEADTFFDKMAQLIDELDDLDPRRDLPEDHPLPKDKDHAKTMVDACAAQINRAFFASKEKNEEERNRILTHLEERRQKLFHKLLERDPELSAKAILYGTLNMDKEDAAQAITLILDKVPEIMPEVVEFVASELHDGGRELPESVLDRTVSEIVAGNLPEETLNNVLDKIQDFPEEARISILHNLAQKAVEGNLPLSVTQNVIRNIQYLPDSERLFVAHNFVTAAVEGRMSSDVVKSAVYSLDTLPAAKDVTRMIIEHFSDNDDVVKGLIYKLNDLPEEKEMIVQALFGTVQEGAHADTGSKNELSLGKLSLEVQKSIAKNPSALPEDMRAQVLSLLAKEAPLDVVTELTRHLSQVAESERDDIKGLLLERAARGSDQEKIDILSYFLMFNQDLLTDEEKARVGEQLAQVQSVDDIDYGSKVFFAQVLSHITLPDADEGDVAQTQKRLAKLIMQSATADELPAIVPRLMVVSHSVRDGVVAMVLERLQEPHNPQVTSEIFKHMMRYANLDTNERVQLAKQFLDVVGEEVAPLVIIDMNEAFPLFPQDTWSEIVPALLRGKPDQSASIRLLLHTMAQRWLEDPYFSEEDKERGRELLKLLEEKDGESGE